MPDEPAPLTADTPTNADTTNWQQRYESLQPEYTRTTQALKDAESVWEDEQALLQRIAEKHPHLLAEEEEETEDDPTFEETVDDPRFKELEALKQWQAQVESERGEARFQADLKTELGDQPVPKAATDWIKARTHALGNNPTALKKAVEEFTSLSEELGTAHLERVKQSKRAPHVPAGGSTPTGVPDFSQMTEKQALDWQVERARGITAQ